MKTIGVLTSGGDSPGMNTALRSIVRTCAHYKIKCVGIVRGYSGLIEDNTKVLNTRSVRGIINKGGTFLYSARCDEFRQATGREKAYKTLRNNNIDGLIVIGGDGSFTGASKLEDEFNFPRYKKDNVTPQIINNTTASMIYLKELVIKPLFAK